LEGDFLAMKVKFGYDCNDKARDFCKEVHKLGYECKVCWGWYDNIPHAWSIIRVNDSWILIETTGGWEIPEKVLDERYRIHHCT